MKEQLLYSEITDRLDTEFFLRLLERMMWDCYLHPLFQARRTYMCDLYVTDYLLLEAIIANPYLKRSYEELTPSILNGIFLELRENFSPLQKHTIADWGNVEFQFQIIQAQKWLQKRLKEVLGYKNIARSIVNKIMYVVFGIPIISPKVKRYLYEYGLIQDSRTQNMFCLMTGMHNFFNRYQDEIVSTISNIVIYRGVFGGEFDERELVVILLMGMSSIIYKKIKRIEQQEQ
jgi:hypothetical protein